MMRRGPLADFPIDALLVDAAADRTNGVLELHSTVDGLVYFVDGEIYLAEIAGQQPLDQRLVSAGLLDQSQVDEHGVVNDEGVYLARALDTDVSIDEEAIDAYLLDVTAATLARFVGVTEGEYELDPYGAHAAGVLSSWTHETVLARVEELRAEAAALEAERLEAERIAAEEAEAERIAAEAAEAERLAAARAEAERMAAERAETERVEAERVAAAREAAERAEAEAEAAKAKQAEAASAEAEQADAERAGDEPDDADADEDASPAADGESPAEADGAEAVSHLPAPPDDAVDEEASDPPEADPGKAKNAPSADALSANLIPLADRKPGGLGELGPGVLVVVPDEPPPTSDKIELEPTEWRVVVLAAQGDSIGGIAERLDLSLDEARAVIENLWCRGLLATIGPGGPAAI